MSRGILTPALTMVAIRALGREITTEELRLMPYVQYVAMNEQTLEFRRMNSVEKEILKQWQIEGFILNFQHKLELTRDFWDAMNTILWSSYVQPGVLVSDWIEIGHCATRVIEGGDPEVVSDRVAFIEKTPRVLVGVDDWEQGSKGKGGESGGDPENGLYGFYLPSRQWCDKRLLEVGFILPEMG